MNPHNPDFEFPIARRVVLKPELTMQQLFIRGFAVTLLIGCAYLWWLP